MSEWERRKKIWIGWETIIVQLTPKNKIKIILKIYQKTNRLQRNPKRNWAATSKTDHFLTQCLSTSRVCIHKTSAYCFQCMLLCLSLLHDTLSIFSIWIALVPLDHVRYWQWLVFVVVWDFYCSMGNLFLTIIYSLSWAAQCKQNLCKFLGIYIFVRGVDYCIFIWLTNYHVQQFCNCMIILKALVSIFSNF